MTHPNRRQAVSLLGAAAAGLALPAFAQDATRYPVAQRFLQEEMTRWAAAIKAADVSIE